MKYYVKLNQYRVIIYDVFGKKVKTDEIRTNFKIYQVARNYILEYQKIISHYNFSSSTDISEIETNSSFRIFKKIQR